MATDDKRRYHLFVYGTLLPGERNHELLATASHLGPATTTARYRLIDLGPSAALVDDGDTEVVGELFEVDVETLAAIDVKMEHPVLFRRARITLSDNRVAHAYLMSADQVRGKRRIPTGRWRRPHGPPGLHEAGPFVRWARGRFR